MGAEERLILGVHPSPPGRDAAPAHVASGRFPYVCLAGHVSRSRKGPDQPLPLTRDEANDLGLARRRSRGTGLNATAEAEDEVPIAGAVFERGHR